MRYMTGKEMILVIIKRIMTSKLERIRYNGVEILSKVYQYHSCYIFTMVQSPCMDKDNILNDQY